MEVNLSNLIYEIEDLLYQFFTWLALFPKTLIKSFFKPAWLPNYISAEFEKEQKERFGGFVNPLVFWFISIIILFWSTTTTPDETGTTLEQFFVSLMVLAIFPIIYAAIMLKGKRITLEHRTLRTPLYIQMLVFGVFQTGFGIILAITPYLFQQANAMTTDTSFFGLAVSVFQLLIAFLALLTIAIPFLWLPIAETIIFTRYLETRWHKAFGWMLLGLIVIIILVANLNAIATELDIISNLISINR